MNVGASRHPPSIKHMLHTLLCLCVFLEAWHVVGGCNGLPFVLGNLPYFTPVWECLPLITPLTLSHWFPVYQYVQGYQYVMWAFPFC